MLSLDEVEKKVKSIFNCDMFFDDHIFPRNDEEVKKLQEEKEKIKNKAKAYSLLRENFEWDKDTNHVMQEAFLGSAHMLRFIHDYIEYILTVHEEVKTYKPFFDEISDKLKDEYQRAHNSEKTVNKADEFGMALRMTRDWLQKNPSLENVVVEINKQLEKIVLNPYEFKAKESSQKIINASKQNVKKV